MVRPSSAAFWPPFPTRVAVHCCQALPGAGILQSAPPSPLVSPHLAIHPSPPTCPGAHEGPKAKKAKKPFATESPTPWIIAAIVQRPYPAIAQSRTVIRWANLKDPSSLTRASHPVFPSHRLCLAHLAYLAHLGLARRTRHPGAQSGRPIANVIRLCQTAAAHLNSDTDHHGVLETHQALKPSFIRPWEAV